MSDDGTGTKQPGDNSGEGTKKVEFTEEQQAAVNTLIQKRLARAEESHTKALDAVKGELTGLKTQLEEAQARAAEAGKKGKDDATVEGLQAKIAEMIEARKPLEQRIEALQREKLAAVSQLEAEQGKLINFQKRAALGKAASAVDFVNLDAVLKLTEDSVQWDAQSGKFVVRGDDGQERLNSAFEPMSLDEFYQEFAAKNPYLVRGDVRAGAGSTPGMRSSLTGDGKYEVKQIFGKGSSAILAQKLKRENPAEYARLKKIATDSRLIS